MFTYGSSFTIVAISLAIDPSAYTQADYCVWMEANYLFYFTFVAPVFIYIMVSCRNGHNDGVNFWINLNKTKQKHFSNSQQGTVIYSGLSMYIMLKKYKTSLKNKEHTRLANARYVKLKSFGRTSLNISESVNGIQHLKAMFFTTIYTYIDFNKPKGLTNTC